MSRRAPGRNSHVDQYEFEHESNSINSSNGLGTFHMPLNDVASSRRVQSRQQQQNLQQQQQQQSKQPQAHDSQLEAHYEQSHLEFLQRLQHEHYRHQQQHHHHHHHVGGYGLAPTAQALSSSRTPLPDPYLSQGAVFGGPVLTVAAPTTSPSSMDGGLMDEGIMSRPGPFATDMHAELQQQYAMQYSMLNRPMQYGTAPAPTPASSSLPPLRPTRLSSQSSQPRDGTLSASRASRRPSDATSESSPSAPYTFDHEPDSPEDLAAGTNTTTISSSSSSSSSSNGKPRRRAKLRKQRQDAADQLLHSIATAKAATSSRSGSATSTSSFAPSALYCGDCFSSSSSSLSSSYSSSRVFAVITALLAVTVVTLAIVFFSSSTGSRWLSLSLSQSYTDFCCAIRDAPSSTSLYQPPEPLPASLHTHPHTLSASPMSNINTHTHMHGSGGSGGSSSNHQPQHQWRGLGRSLDLLVEAIGVGLRRAVLMACVCHDDAVPA